MKRRREEEKWESKEKGLASFVAVAAAFVVVHVGGEVGQLLGAVVERRRRRSTGRSIGEGPSYWRLEVVPFSTYRGQ